MRLEVPRSDLARLGNALQCEWLITNELGGFAAGTVAMANTRRYHAFLVAALRPPVDRVVMVGKVDVAVRYGEHRFELGCNEFGDGTISPRGYEYLTDFALENGLPVWTYGFEDAVIEQRIWMERGGNTSYLSVRLVAGRVPAGIELIPLCTYRDYHAHARGNWNLEVRPEPRGCHVHAFAGARPYRLETDRGEFRADTAWYWNYRHRLEAERGLDALEDLFRPGTFHAQLQPGESLVLTASAETGELKSGSAALEGIRRQRQGVLRNAPADAPEWVRQLTLAADQFIVSRADEVPQRRGATVIAGYPWFSDWGRDTMIALPGLAIATGRWSAAAQILRTFARFADQGMLPNRFPDGGEPPEYNTVDAALWLFHAVAEYLDATGDLTLLRELYPTLREIVAWHCRGTRFGIAVDPQDGLLRAGATGVQLTWMDAKVGDRVITARIGKPVEINALWHFALTSMARWGALLGDAQPAAKYAEQAARVATAFAAAFWFEQGGYLYDVVDGPDGIFVQGRAGRVDTSLRPNQIFAVSLGAGLLDSRRSRAVIECCSRELLTPVGLRSLARNHPDYVGKYMGDPAARDAVYHQGTVWSWLLGPFALAHFRVFGDAAHANALVARLAPHLGEACLGSISEIFDGDAPHAPRGCFAQAWSVAETLRAWHALRRLS